MIILFAPAKSFRTVSPKNDFKGLNKETQGLVKSLSKMAEADIEKKFKVSPALALEIRSYYKHFSTNPAFTALDLFYGESYKTLSSDTLTIEDRQFMHDQVYIVDALYGLIKPLDSIKPYRLDFTISGLNLNTIWIPLYKAVFEREEAVLSLASDEFTSKIKPYVPIYEVHFMDCKQAVCKPISVFNKQQRGYLLRYVVQKRIQTVDDLPINFNGYTLKKLDYQLIYERLVD